MTYAGHPLRYAFLYPATRYLMLPWPVPVEGQDYDVGVTPELHARGRAELPPDSTDPYVEYRCLIGNLSCSLNKIRYRDRTEYGALSVSVTATFFETMVGGVEDSGLPASA